MGEDIYNSDAVQGIIGDGFGALDDTYTMSALALDEAMKVVQGLSLGGLCSCVPLLKVEIVRDFMQTLGVIFSKLFDDVTFGLVQTAKSVWGKIFNFVTVDLYAIVQSKQIQQIAIIVAIVLAIVCFLCYVWLCYESMQTVSNELREGHETVTWKERAENSKKKTKMTTYMLTLCLSAFVPVSKAAVELAVCTPSMLETLPPGDFFNCQDGGIKYVAFALLALYTLPLPLLLVYIIQKNKPRGSILDANITYDADGVEVPFTDKLYLERIETDPNQAMNPFRSLYAGFERKWAWYKVIQMMVKLGIVVPAIVLATSKDSAIACFAILLVYCLISFYASPFVDINNDVVDGSGRLCAALSCAGAMVLALIESDGSDSAGAIIGLVINLITAFNVLLMMLLVLWKLGPVQSCMKNTFGLFSFRDTTLKAEGPPKKILERWDLQKEVKHRIWHHFWDSILLNACGTEVAERNMELKLDTQNYGLEKIKAHWDGDKDPNVAEARMFARRSLEGVDLFRNNVFGKLWIDDYPYHMFFVHDESDTVDVIFADDQVHSFNDLQMDPDITERRHLRQRLRALSCNGGKFEHPFERQEVIRCADGTETDKDGNTKTVYSNVTFTIHYTNCNVHVGSSNDSVPMAAGFKVSVNYNDGWGEARLPRTGQMKRVDNRQASMPKEHIGVTNTYEPNPENQAIFDRTEHLWQDDLESLRREATEYREGLIRKKEEANRLLSNGFWFAVYNDPTIPQGRLARYLEQNEQNEVLKEIPTKHTAGLGFLYKRLQFCSAHPAWALWYCFWDELWSSNHQMTVMQPLNDDINPTSGKSIAYRPMPREKLEPWLEERGLTGGCCKRLIAGPTLDALYERMDAETQASRK